MVRITFFEETPLGLGTEFPTEFSTGISQEETRKMSAKDALFDELLCLLGSGTYIYHLDRNSLVVQVACDRDTVQFVRFQRLCRTSPDEFYALQRVAMWYGLATENLSNEARQFTESMMPSESLQDQLS